MNPLVIAIGGVVLLGGGYLAYKFVQASSPINQLTKDASDAVSGTESILNKDPISVTSVAKDVYGGAGDAFGKLESYL
jgi:hypothetical protein